MCTYIYIKGNHLRNAVILKRCESYIYLYIYIYILYLYIYISIYPTIYIYIEREREREREERDSTRFTKLTQIWQNPICRKPRIRKKTSKTASKKQTWKG